MRIFRLEARHNGIGFYGLQDVSPYRYTARDIGTNDYNSYHSNPFHDEGLKDCPVLRDRNNPFFRSIDEEYQCAFNSIEQFHSWFPPNRMDDLAKEHPGVCLAEYEVSEAYVYHGALQVLYDSRKAKLIEQHKPNAFNKETNDVSA